ncbi:prepilin-type N-terminal cleavage/methylation domain-containing protein [Nitrincola tapanii]|uniref:Prepilin-type N-terminal cleavage/methylation domain-containing protein n=1 Tax=Nitrincola tapanii TaxID=1708751 RepID=A0A5A9W0Y8_9GAMM|nr:prepilin-type N-terminal cleavage/methylation domain-containing protein [Nitrincola tapanii]KAA0874386.1 prepilin-type N-terminal cleavage/methylation domain-containing protein [Nitrincola tapanii]
MSCLIDCKPRSRGFTLLEMLVVLMLTTLIAAVLMQSFLYMAGVFGSVERRQKALAQIALQRGWFQDSARSLVNGVDGEGFSVRTFRGERQSFQGLTATGLSYSGGVARPVEVVWRIEQDERNVRVYYRELHIGGEAGPWFQVGEWQGTHGYFSYFSQGEWRERFPEEQTLLSLGSNLQLPDAVKLVVEGGRFPLTWVVHIASNSLPYQAPKPDEQ